MSDRRLTLHESSARFNRDSIAVRGSRLLVREKLEDFASPLVASSEGRLCCLG